MRTVGWMLVTCLMACQTAHAQAGLRTATVASGAGSGSDEGVTLHSILGQPFVGPGGSAETRLGAGQWHQIAPVLSGTTANSLTAQSDGGVTLEDEAITLDVLGNDTDLLGGAITILNVTEPGHGTVVVQDETRVLYTPDADFNGDDDFLYTAQTESGERESAEVHVTVQAVNDPPSFTSEPKLAAAAGQPYSYDLAASDVDGDSLAFYAVTLPSWLTLEGGIDGAAVLKGVPAEAAAGDNAVVIAVNDGTVEVRQSFVVAVALSAPQTPLAVSPVDGAVSVSMPASFEWDEVAFAVSYHLQISALVDFSATAVDTSGIDTTSITIDSLPTATRYFWRVRAENGAGASPWSDAFWFETASPVSIHEEEESVPSQYALMQNYPNPFNPVTQIQFTLPEASHVSIEVFDMLGRRTATLLDAMHPAGRFGLAFDASNMPAGVYIARMRAGDFVATRRMVLLK